VLDLFATIRKGAPCVLVALALLAGAPAPALADNSPAASDEDIAKAKQHFARGRAAFDKKDFKGAVAAFKESYRLSRNPLLLYNIGFTLDQLGDRSMALFYYQKYLQDAPKSDGNRETAATRVVVLERELEEETQFVGPGVEASGKPPAKKADKEAAKAAPAPAPEVDGFQHNVIDEAPPGRPIDVSAFVPRNAPWKVVLFYRAAGESKFTAVKMTPRYNELIARIPASKTTGASVQYYIEVRDAGGAMVERSGRSTSPHLVFLDRGAKARYYADLGDESARPISEDEATAAGGGFSVTDGSGRGGAGWTDAGSSRFRKLKWGATGGAAGLLALSGTFYLLSSKASSDLEAEALASRDPAQCVGGDPPCRAFSERQQSLEARGQRFETLAHVSLGIGATAAVGAGVLWFLEVRESKSRRRSRQSGPDEPSFSAAPVLGADFVGATAAVRF
jgi:tetratricopeptide (TPR) repeat protein